MTLTCPTSTPAWACAIGASAGYASTALWFLVLVPQLYHNYLRKSTRGLSIWWALANFTASLVNVFFVFRLQLPLYTKIMAVYMPILECAVLGQFWWYRSGTPSVWVGGTAISVWFVLVFVQSAFPAWTNDMQWIATVLWCIETFPQLWLNATLSESTGQAIGTVAITVLGKTTDMLAAFLVAMPLQVRVLCFFSTATAYANAIQVIWYSWQSSRKSKMARASRHMTYSPLTSSEGTISEAAESGHAVDELQQHQQLFEGGGSLNSNATEKKRHDQCCIFIRNLATVYAVLASGVVAALLTLLVVFCVLFVQSPVNYLLLASEAVLVAICIAVPRYCRRPPESIV